MIINFCMFGLFSQTKTDFVSVNLLEVHKVICCLRKFPNEENAEQRCSIVDLVCNAYVLAIGI